MKKRTQTFIISSVVMASLSTFQGQVFGYLEEKIYCAIEGEQLTLYIKQEEGLHKCDTYIKATQQLGKEKYDEILLILKYINQGDDVAYRKEIFELKKQEFLKLITYRTTILTMIQEFEQKFFVMYQESLHQSLTPYLQTLQEMQTRLNQENLITSLDEKTQIFYQQIMQQILVVQSILNATVLDEIMDQIPAYLYLKWALEWK